MYKWVALLGLLLMLTPIKPVQSGTVPPSGTIPQAKTPVLHFPLIAHDYDSTAPTIAVAPLVGRYAVVPVGEQLQVFCRLGKPTVIVSGDVLIVGCKQ